MFSCHLFCLQSFSASRWICWKQFKCIREWLCFRSTSCLLINIWTSFKHFSENNVHTKVCGSCEICRSGFISHERLGYLPLNPSRGMNWVVDSLLPMSLCTDYIEMHLKPKNCIACENEKSILWIFSACLTDFVDSALTGRSDVGGPPPGGAVSVQGLWFCRPDRSGFWVCALQCAGLLLFTCAQIELERQEPDHTPVSAIWSCPAAGTQDTAPAVLRCSAGWGAHLPPLHPVSCSLRKLWFKELFFCRKSHSARWGPGCLPLEPAGTRTPTGFSQGTALQLAAFFAELSPLGISSRWLSEK